MTAASASPPPVAACSGRPHDPATPLLRRAQVEQLAVEIENPFGLDFNDLPLEAFCLTVEADALRMMNELDQSPGSASDAPNDASRGPSPVGA